MTEKEIKELQEETGAAEIQSLIDSGRCWLLEGSMGRTAMWLLEEGVCYLPKESFRDYYGNIVPSRDQLEPGAKGTLKNSIDYWTRYKEVSHESTRNDNTTNS